MALYPNNNLINVFVYLFFCKKYIEYQFSPCYRIQTTEISSTRGLKSYINPCHKLGLEFLRSSQLVVVI